MYRIPTNKKFTINQKYLSPGYREDLWTEFTVYHPQITEFWPVDPTATFTEAPQFWALIMEFFFK